jgi:hypothetical protein
MSKKEEISMFQLYQKLDKSLLFRVVVNENFKESILTDLKLEIIKRVGNLPLEFEIVNEIQRNPNTGKIRCVISEIK